MAGAVDEDIFKRRFTHRNGLYFSGECFDHVGYEVMSILALQPNFIVHNCYLNLEANADAVRERLWIVGFYKDHVPADFVFEFRRCAQRDQFSFMENCQPVAALRLFHQMSCDDHRDLFLIAQDS